MYAVIQTGGKQYRVQAGDVLVVEKLDGEAGAEIAFDKVLMVGGEGGITVGAPLVAGAVVTATLIETRKAKKIKVFKKIRRQGYRRTNGHRQPESVLRVTSLEAGKLTSKWDGEVDLTPRAELVSRARGLALRSEFAQGSVEVEPMLEPAGAELDDVQTAELAKDLAKPAKAKTTAEGEPAAETAKAKPAPKKAAVAKAETQDKPAAAEEPAARKAKSADDADSAE